MAKEKNFTRGPRIRSGGQTGIDRAALDAAVLTGRPYEGWCPKGGWAEDFLRPPGLLTIYPHLMETPSESPERRTDWNVRDSAATVVFVPDSKYSSRGTDFTIECAKKYGKPYCIIHYMDRGAIIDARPLVRQPSTASWPRRTRPCAGCRVRFNAPLRGCGGLKVSGLRDGRG